MDADTAAKKSVPPLVSRLIAKTARITKIMERKISGRREGDRPGSNRRNHPSLPGFRIVSAAVIGVGHDF